jgi:ABC-type transport system substrate-binding protein
VGRAIPREPGGIVWAIRYDPRTFDAAKVDEQDSEIVRYLNAGILLRINRETQQPEPQLAQSFLLSPDGNLLSFKLRNNLHFSDGSSFTSDDVAWSLRRVLAAETKASAADDFPSPGRVTIDVAGHRAKLSILTNAGNMAWGKMATLTQQDMSVAEIIVTIVTQNSPARIERPMHKQDCEARLLGLSDIEPDPSSMINIRLSSSPNHQWNPAEKSPATAWEAEIDPQMQRQASSLSQSNRNLALDRVRQIVADQQPFIYLVYPNALEAISPRLAGVRPSILSPRLVWNIDSISRAGEQR